MGNNIFSTPIRILHLLTLNSRRGEYGGPVSVARELCCELDRRGYSTEIFTGAILGSEPNEPRNNFETYAHVRTFSMKYSFSSLWSWKHSVQLFHKIEKADLIHIHFAREIIPIQAAIMCIFYKKRYFIQTHGMISIKSSILAKALDYLFIRQIFIRAQYIFVLTDFERTQLELQNFSGNYYVLRNGIARNKINTELGSKRTILNIVQISRITHRKRLDRFIDLAKELSMTSELKFNFKFYGPDEGNLSELISRIHQLDIDNTVTYEGALTSLEVASVLLETDLLVLLSDDEPYPMVIIEALNSGCCVIINSTCGFADSLSKFAPQYVVDANDSKAILDKCYEIFSSLNRSDIRLFNQELAQKLFGIEEIVDQLVANFSEVNKSSSRRYEN